MSATTPTSVARFHHFLAQITRLVDIAPSEAELLSQARQCLQALITHDDWLLPEFAQPHPQHYQQYLLYADPQDRFSVVSFVGAPRVSTPIHDHTVWGLVGMLRGSEFCQPYSRMSDGRWAPAGFQIDMLPGDIEAISPRIGDVHKVWNALADEVCVSIHVYGGNIGLIERNSYREDGSRSKFVSGYSNITSVAEAPIQPPPLVVPHAPSIASVIAASPPTVATPVAVTAPEAEMAAQASPQPNNDSATEVIATEAPHPYAVSSYAHIRAALLAKEEIALVDVREEDAFAQSHPLFAINIPYGRIEVDAWRRIPRRTTAVVVYDNGEGLALLAIPVLQRMGYSQLSVMQNGLAGWAAAGGELFRDVNVPSKSFGELVEAQRKTPSFSAHEVKAYSREAQTWYCLMHAVSMNTNP
jgi:predicted metal-dependent enzyme (double-stranded beta helix superfamily)/rhodanese-related sulfurtransferase